MHWAKVVNSEGKWRWTKADMGIRGRFLSNPPVHVYQTVLRFRTNLYPNGRSSEGYLLGGPLLFDTDLIESRNPFSLWRLVDSADMVQELHETVSDRSDCVITRVTFSGFRGIHVAIDQVDILEESIKLGFGSNPPLKSFQRERMQTARSIGHWCPDWDWIVSADIWRVARVPWSIHGLSALRAITFTPPYTPSRFREQLKQASPFSFDRQLRIRIIRPVPLFTFIDGETYGPYRKDWVTRLPIAVALHLIWQDFAKPRDAGPWSAGAWFERGWQILFHESSSKGDMVKSPLGGDGG